MTVKLFQDRSEAGKLLGWQLLPFAEKSSIVLALPRGGVPVGYEIAKLLHIPLDIIIVRKIGLPASREFGVGAIVEGGALLIDNQALEKYGLSTPDLKEIITEETAELKRRIKIYRGSSKFPSIKNRAVILVDDGLATGISAQAAVMAIKQFRPKKIIFAAPVCAYDSMQKIFFLVDDVVCLVAPPDLEAISHWYLRFEQVSDAEVLKLLQTKISKS
jgi:putative phosphoribosyl transferase